MVDIRSLVIDFYESKAPGRKTFMLPDIYRGIKKTYDKKGQKIPFGQRAMNKVINTMVINHEAEYWSSGSTTYLRMLKPFDELRAASSLEEKLDFIF